MVPYEACVKAGASTVMSAFNDLSGIPSTANYYTLTKILKDRWKFDGFVVSDWNAINQLINQGVATNRKEAGYKAFMAGVDMDMVDDIYLEYLPQLIAEKKVPMERVDDAVSRILRVKFLLGLFDHPYTKIVDDSARYLQLKSKAIAQKLAAESMVLLKNNNKTLPLTISDKQIALIGPMAMDKSDLLGSWSSYGNGKDVESIFEGLGKEFGNAVKINYAKGCDFDGDDESGFNEAISVAQKSDVILVCLGEKKEWTGENASRSTISLPAIQEKLVQKLKKIGKPIVLILSNGRPLALAGLEPLADAILEIWQPGVAGGSTFAGILSGRINPSGKLSITFPLTTGQIPMYYDMRPSARPDLGKYQDIPTEPLYWFGHGLSYTTFFYGKLKLSTTKLKKTENLTAEVEVKNTGKVPGVETVFWYIADPVCSISRPLKELKYFEREEIAPGAKKIYKFEIEPNRDLSYTNANGIRFLEAGDYYVIVGNQKVKFEIEK
jgi:beta-glucosidase